VDQDPHRPSLSPFRVLEARQVTPDSHQRYLQGIARAVEVAEDAVRHAEQSIAQGEGDSLEGLAIAPLRLFDEQPVHRHSVIRARRLGHKVWLRGGAERFDYRPSRPVSLGQ
jgi:hypothetical protein